MKDSESAFPYSYEVAEIKDGHFCETFHFSSGLTKKEYAAIKLKVHRSGDPEIDAMIQESRRDEFAKAAMAGILVGNSTERYENVICHRAVSFSDAMLAELEKEAGK
jgi:hypothetical protein